MLKKQNIEVLIIVICANMKVDFDMDKVEIIGCK
jgi:hypothetical protein